MIYEDKNKVVITDIDNIYAQIHAPNDIFSSLYDYYSIYVKNHWYITKNYPNWDGRIKFIMKSGKTYQGLVPEIKKYLKNENIKINDKRQKKVNPKPTQSEFMDAYKKLDFVAYKPHKHQIRAVLKSIIKKRGIILHATGSGKTLTATIALNYLMYHNKINNVLYVVPRSQLVDQTHEKMIEYGFDESLVGKFYGGDKELKDNGVTIATWQSISYYLKKPKKYKIYDENSGSTIFVDNKNGAIKKLKIKSNKSKRKLKSNMEDGKPFKYRKKKVEKYDASKHNKIRKDLTKYLKSVGCFLVDECHGLDAKEIKNVATKVVDAEYRFGFTGSMPDKNDDLSRYTTIKALLGEIIDEQYEKDLIKEKKLAPLNIKVVFVSHRNKNFSNYRDEKEYLMQSEKRNGIIVDIAEHHRIKEQKNVLILVEEIQKHFDILKEMYLSKISNNEKIHFIHGGIRSKNRENIRKIVSNTYSNTILASIGTTSTGIDIPNLGCVILAMSGKSKIRLFQSIGRGLRYVENKELDVYDIADDVKYSNRHLESRLKYFGEREYPVEIIDEQELNNFII